MLFGLTRNLPALKLSFVRFPTRLSPYKYCVVDLGKLTELLALVLLHRYCKSFNVLSSGLCGRAASVSEQPCKVTAFFLSGQIFRRKNFQNPEPSGNPACYTPRGICAHAWPAAGHPPASVSFPKAGAKLQLSSLPTKFSENFFLEKNPIFSRHLTHIPMNQRIRLSHFYIRFIASAT